MKKILYFIKFLPFLKGSTRGTRGRDFLMAFTLVELVVGITISMLLMVSVGVFISGGMQNVFLQQKVFENAGDFISFNTTLHSRLDAIQSDPITSSDSLFFKSEKYFGNGGFTYIGTGASTTGFYCSGSEVPADDITQHIFIKDFIPFFEDSSEASLDDIFSASVGPYTSSVKQHIVMDGSNVIVGKNTFGSELGSIGLETYLNSPTGLALKDGILYISDTLNNRILAYDTTDSSIIVLLDETDGLDEPTGLTFSGSSLLIANSAAREILEYSSEAYTDFPNISASLDNTYNNIVRFEFEVLKDGSRVDISGLTEDDFTQSSDDFLQIDNNDIAEYFILNYGIAEPKVACTGIGKRMISGVPVDCIAVGQGKVSSPDSEDISTLNVENMDNIAETLSSGTYYIKLTLFDNSSTAYEGHLPYFTQGNDDLFTKDNNTLRVIMSDLDYPSGLDNSGASLVYQSFSGATFTDYSFNETYDSVLETPIQDFGVDITNDLLTMTGSYYKSYDCFNPDNRVTREFIWKKSLK